MLPVFNAMHALTICALASPLSTRGYARRCNGAILDIAVDVNFYKSAKIALRTALDEQDGALSDDALAMVDALADVNPTRPDPSEDNDLWSGSFDLASSALSVGSVRQRGSGSIEVDDDGKMMLFATLEASADEGGGALSLVLTGTLRASDDAELELACEQVGLAQLEDADTEETKLLISACEGATGLSFAESTSEVQPDLPRWDADAPLPTLRLAQLYLDQELHIVVPTVTAAGEVGKDLDAAVRKQRLAVLFRPM